MVVGWHHVRAQQQKTQVAPTELNSLICIKCYKQAAPLGLKERQASMQLQGRVCPKCVKLFSIVPTGLYRSTHWKQAMNYLSIISCPYGAYTGIWNSF